MTFLTRFCDLWDAYKKDAMLRLYRRLEYEIRSIAMSIINLAAEAATVLPNDEVTQIKNVGFELRSLGEWIGYIGDGEAFTKKGEEIFQKSEQLRKTLQYELGS